MGLRLGDRESLHGDFGNKPWLGCFRLCQALLSDLRRQNTAACCARFPHCRKYSAMQLHILCGDCPNGESLPQDLLSWNWEVRVWDST